MDSIFVENKDLKGLKILPKPNAQAGSPASSRSRLQPRQGLATRIRPALCPGLATLIATLIFLSSAPAHAQYTGYRRSDSTPQWQHKYLNLALGFGGMMVNLDPDGRVIGPGGRFFPTFGLQSGIGPVMADFRITTDPTYDFGAGAFLKLTPLYRGWLMLSPFGFLRMGERRIISNKFKGQEMDDMWGNFGLGVRLEYLIYKNTLSFFVEVRQTVLNPWETDATFGVSWSPLMFLLWRNNEL